jgi:hypothetical protein
MSCTFLREDRLKSFFLGRKKAKNESRPKCPPPDIKTPKTAKKATKIATRTAFLGCTFILIPVFIP